MYTTWMSAAGLGLFLGLLACLEAGRRVGLARAGAEGERPGLGAVAGAVYGLLGLLIAFTFSGAAARFESRRDLIVREANAIGTAYLRLDLLPEESRQRLKQKMRRYLEGRLEVYGLLPDLDAARAALGRSAALQAEIWADAVAATREAPPPATGLVLAALNETFDITTTRTVAAQAHPPAVIFVLLAAMALLSAFLAGHEMAGGKARSLLHMLAYAAVIAGVIYVIVDLEFPRLGLIRIDAADAVLTDLLRGMR